MRIAIVQSRVTLKWGYCPEEVRELLQPEFCEDANAPTALDAVNAALADSTVPPGRHTFIEYPVQS